MIIQPPLSQPLLDAYGMVSRPWADYFQRVAAAAIGFATRSVTGDYTASAGECVSANATGGAITVTLQDAASVPGELVCVVKSDSSGNNVSVTSVGGGTVTLSAQYQTCVAISSNGVWVRV